jgi:hypothetical protein
MKSKHWCPICGTHPDIEQTLGKKLSGGIIKAAFLNISCEDCGFPFHQFGDDRPIFQTREDAELDWAREIRSDLGLRIATLCTQKGLPYDDAKEKILRDYEQTRESSLKLPGE